MNEWTIRVSSGDVAQKLPALLCLVSLQHLDQSGQPEEIRVFRRLCKSGQNPVEPSPDLD
jgi:hypothetical protein